MPPNGAVLVIVYTGAIFLSAALLFSIQPMFTKMVLPVLGGSPSVWSMAMVFFQALLLAGYAYAHLLATRMGLRLGTFIHLLFLAAAAATLPIAARGGVAPPADTDPSLWLVGVFALSVGLPFLALSAHGPLLQAWFARSGHARAEDPYFLYAASNIGSFAALLGYPLVIEPFLGLSAQSAAWSMGFMALVALIAGVGLLGGRSGVVAKPGRDETPTTIPLSTKAKWTALAFAPSGLLVAVTAHMSTDVGAAPLVWVIPLGLYLLTFPLAFRTRSPSWDYGSVCVQFWTGALVLMSIALGNLGAMNGLIMTPIHLGFFFVSAVVSHRALYLSRPPSQMLTSFYLCLSFGGMLGGLFAGLAAPLMFSSLAEYPMLVVAAFACAPQALSQLKSTTRHEILKFAMLFAIGAAAIAILTAYTSWAWQARVLLLLLVGLPIMINWRLRGRTLLLAGLALITIFNLQTFTQGESYRSFFGVTRIDETGDGAIRRMMHGTTLHGAIRLRNTDGSPVSGRPTPTTYYTLAGPMGETIAAIRKARGSLDHAAVVGLGAGTLACHFGPSERVTFYEIDPVVVQLATDRTRFRFLSDCEVKSNIVLGDARLTLAQQDRLSEVIVVDAFSSDAIPMHLLTREAVGVYLSKLAPNGALVMHISNKIVELSDIIARIGAEHGLVTYVVTDVPVAKEEELASASKVAVLARSKDDLRDLLNGDRNWTAVTPPATYPLWTDDRSTIFTALAAKWWR